MYFFSTWLEQNSRLQCVRHYLTALCRATLSADPAQVSALFIMTVAKSCGGFRQLFWPEKRTIQGGTGALIQR
jgi:hypothetical protein